MNRQEQQRALQQLETVIEQAHRLQLELLRLLRSMMEIEPPPPPQRCQKFMTLRSFSTCPTSRCSPWKR